MAKVMYIEAASGLAGDMLLGALVDAGVPVDVLRTALDTLGVAHTLEVSRVVRAGVTATSIRVLDAPSGSRAQHVHQDDHGGGHHHHPSEHGHSHHAHDAADGHHHHEHGHRALSDIRHLIQHSGLTEAAKDRATRLFERLGEAEAAIHGVAVEDVHFHEVGAVDSIVDIVGFVVAMEWLAVDDVVASPVNVGSGTVTIAHGTFPVPAPATARLLAGVPVYSAGPATELTTPTGALLVSGYAKAYGTLPHMSIAAVGYGAGMKDFPDVPNVVRVFLGERTAAPGVHHDGQETVLTLACEIDDMNPQLFGPAAERLFEAGALDVFLTAVQMKKGRPGTLVTVLAPEDKRRAVSDALFTHTTTLGVRVQRIDREILERHWVEVPVTGGVVRIKIAGRDHRVLNAAPEFDDCERVATATGRPIKDVQIEAMTKWRQGS